MSTSGMHISDALNDCLDLISHGSTVEECLERYPDLSDELAPLLGLSIRTQMAAETVVASPEAQRAGLGRITDAWTAMQERRHRRSPWWLLRRSWVLAAVAALVLAFGGWTTAAAAQDSVPGEVLYPVKEVQERVLLLVVFTNGGKADLHAKLAHARTIEATKLAAKGVDADTVDEATGRMEEHAREAVALMGGELSADATGASGVVRLHGSGHRSYSLSRYASVSGVLTIEQTQFGPPDGAEFVRPWSGRGSLRRSAMQERFYDQIQQLRDMRQGLPNELHDFHRARLEAAFLRSEQILLEAFLVMWALEDAQNPPE